MIPDSVDQMLAGMSNYMSCHVLVSAVSCFISLCPVKNSATFCVLIFEEKIGLITKIESEESSVTKQEAEKFIQEDEKKEMETPADAPLEDADDLLGQL